MKKLLTSFIKIILNSNQNQFLLILFKLNNLANTAKELVNFNFIQITSHK